MDNNTVPSNSGNTVRDNKPKPPLWLLYTAIVLSGLLFLGEAAGITVLQKVPAKLAIALLFTAFALLVGKGRPTGYIAVGLVWLTVITLFII